MFASWTGGSAHEEVVVPEFFHLCISSPKFGACLPCPALCMALQLQVDKVDSPLHLVSLTNRKPLSGERSQLLQSNVIEWCGLLFPLKKCNYGRVPDVSFGDFRNYY